MKIAGVEVPFCFWLLFAKGFRMKFETLQAKMDKHSDKGEKCETCPQLSACVEVFDRRCDSDINCPKCHRWNKRVEVCVDCGSRIRLTRHQKKVAKEELAIA